MSLEKEKLNLRKVYGDFRSRNYHRELPSGGTLYFENPDDPLQSAEITVNCSPDADILDLRIAAGDNEDIIGKPFRSFVLDLRIKIDGDGKPEGIGSSNKRNEVVARNYIASDNKCFVFEYHRSRKNPNMAVLSKIGVKDKPEESWRIFSTEGYSFKSACEIRKKDRVFTNIPEVPLKFDPLATISEILNPSPTLE